MNLLEDEWLKAVRCNGDVETIETLKGLWEIVKHADNPVVDLVSPRADFKGALYQLLIGLIQTTFAPKNEDAWEKYWHAPPPTDVLKNAFLTVTEAFVLDQLGESNPDGPVFMQDLDPLSDREAIAIASLLIDTSGGGTFFVKEGTTLAISPYWASVALFALQINAPPGGSGHRTGLRGGGPLTTLVLPDERQQPFSLWQKLWLNVLTQKEAALLSGNPELTDLPSIFPWLAPTRTSEAGKKDSVTDPEHAHQYQMYWGMPRRIRLDFQATQSGYCDISHEASEALVVRYRTKNLGVNYSSAWLHPLTPYVRDPKKEPYSVKAQPGGFSYRHWLGLVLNDDKNHKQAAKIVQIYLDSRQELIGGDFQPRLWLFGYDMDNMKARCWYETTMPVFPIPQESRNNLQSLIGQMIDAATEVALDIRSALKQAWFEKPKEIKGDVSFSDAQFWQLTESDFYRLMAQLIVQCDDDKLAADILKTWQRILQSRAVTVFDHWALSTQNEDGDLKRVVAARRQLEIWLYAGKHMKALAA